MTEEMSACSCRPSEEPCGWCKDGGLLVYRCERGHQWAVGNDWYGEGGARVKPPRRLLCWAPWGGDICGLYGYRAASLRLDVDGPLTDNAGTA